MENYIKRQTMRKTLITWVEFTLEADWFSESPAENGLGGWFGRSSM